MATTPNIIPQPNKEELVKVIKAMQLNGCEQQAREFDKLHNIGFFDGSLQKRIDEARNVVQSKDTELWLSRFITVHPKMIEIKDEIRKLAPLKDNVLIIGQTGTGKELLARALHGNRQQERFVELNCAGLPEKLIESELFGHVKGAFTGAISAKEGLLTIARGGTMFLDEVGELKMELQAKLLRALQERRIRKVGGNISESIDCRIVAATHQDLELDIKEKRFRKDFYYRLNDFIIQTLPICERFEDIPLIIDSLETKKTFPHDKVNWQELCAAGLLDGNVRSIQHIVRNYQVLGRLPKVPSRIGQVDESGNVRLVVDAANNLLDILK